MNQFMFDKYKSFSSKDFAADDDFVRYVCHPKETDNLFWEAFCHVFPEKSRDVREAKLLIQALQPDQSEMLSEEVESLWNALSTKHNEIFSSRQVENTVQFALVRRAFLMASMVLVSCLSGALLAHLLKKEEIYEYKTGFEQVATVLLPDSSKVILNANSSVSMWNSGWFKKKRELKLTGEANFNIKKQTSSGRYHKLLVHTNSGTIEVTGTIFNVFSRGSKTKIYLKEGSIKLNNLPDLPVILMHPGDYIQYDVLDKTISKNKVAPEWIDSWILNKIVFDKTPFSDVLSHLKEIHGLEVVLKNKSLLDRSFTGILPADDLDLLLKALEEAFDINMTIKDNKLLITLK